MIQVIDLKKSFKDGNQWVQVLNGVSFTIHQGDFVSIVGASGSGKSTLLTIIGSLQEPSEGKVIFQDKDITTQAKEDLAVFRQKNVGFVFQQMHLIPYLTAEENVMLPMLPLKLSKEEQLEKARWALNKVGLSTKGTRMPDQLSGGEQGRVALARAIVNKPPIILADEPTGNLDSKTGESIMELFKELNNEGQTILFITHHPGHASYGKRKFEIIDGFLQETG